MARLKRKKTKLGFTAGLTDYFFVDRKIQGCETQLNKIEDKLLKLKTKKGLWKILSIRKIERLVRSYKDYEKLLHRLEAIQDKKMHRAVIYQDAMQDISESLDNLKLKKKARKNVIDKAPQPGEAQ